MSLDTLSSRTNIYASLEAYWLNAREMELLVTPVFDTLIPTLSQWERLKAMQSFMQDIVESAKKLQTFRERRNLYMDSEWQLTSQFGNDEKAKNEFLLKELVTNNIEISLKPSLVLLNRSLKSRMLLGKFFYDAELLPPFRAEVQKMDLGYWLDTWKRIEKAQMAGQNIWDESVRLRIYRSIVEKLNPKGKPWILQMLDHGNWKNMSPVKWYTDVHIGAPNDPKSDVVEILQMYETQISRFTSQNGELYKNKLAFEKKGTLPTETRFFQEIILPPQTPSYIHGVVNAIHYHLFNLTGGQDIEDSLAGITHEWKNLWGIDRLTHITNGVISALGWSMIAPKSLQFDAFWRAAEALMKVADIWEKVQILALLSKVLWLKHPLVITVSHI